MSDPSSTTTVIRFRLAGFLLFSAVLVLAGGALSFGVLELATGARHGVASASNARPAQDPPAPKVVPPWGELVVREIEIERPEEYVGFDIAPRAILWTFAGLSLNETRDLMLAAGVAEAQVVRALSDQVQSATSEGTVLRPDDELVLSLAPQVRSKLYHELGRNAANPYQREPYRLHRGDLQKWFAGKAWDPSVVRLIERLMYPRGEVLCFSDYELVAKRLPSDSQRVELAKVLSRQRALLVRLRVRPETDVATLLGYWTVPGVHPKDLRPLFESLTRLPQGGTASIAFLLPPFARQRLYTYPMPSSDTRSPSVDCHWSTLNFFNEVPDDRFADASYGAAFIREHFYPVAAPSRYGDRIFLIDSKGNAVHSAVYIADDIVFTKNGYGFAQPWMLMHVKDMLDTYGYSELLSMVTYRDKSS